MAKLVMNQQKHKCPEPNHNGRHRASPVYNADGMPIAQSREPFKEIIIKCVCGVEGKVTILAKQNRYFGPKLRCDECRKLETIFGEGKNFLNALEGL